MHILRVKQNIISYLLHLSVARNKNKKKKEKPFQNSFSIVAWDVQCVTHWTFITSPPVTWAHASLHLTHVHAWPSEFHCKAEMELASRRCLLLQWTLGVYRERVCEALLELLLLFYFIALLPLNPETEIISVTRHSSRHPPTPPLLQKKHPKIGILVFFLAAYWIWSWTAELAAYQHVYRKQEHCKKWFQKKKVSAVEFHSPQLILKGLGPLENEFRCKCSKKKKTERQRRRQKQRNDQRRESLPLVYWTHCIPDFSCKEKLVIK